MNELMAQLQKTLGELQDLSTRLEAKEVSVNLKDQDLAAQIKALDSRDAAQNSKDIELSARENKVGVIENFDVKQQKLDNDINTFTGYVLNKKAELDKRESDLTEKEATYKMQADKLSGEVAAQQVREQEYKDKIDAEIKEKFAGILS